MFSSSWIAFRNPSDIWEKHWSFLVIEALFLIEGSITFRHAFSSKGYWRYLWLAIFGHGIFVEAVCYTIPDIQNFWHAQASVMLLDHKLPLYITFLYPTFLYTAAVSAEKLQLSWWAKPFAAGLLTVLMDIPTDILGIKLLWWTWHDTDPNIMDRTYSVPWTSYYFHAAFASSLVFLFNGYHWLICKRNVQEISFSKMMICVLLTACTTMPAGILQFIPLYHILHDKVLVHTEVCLCIYLAACGLVVWISAMNRNRNVQDNEAPFKQACTTLKYGILCYYLALFLIAVYVKPENIVSVGVHETIGDCNEYLPVHTPLGDVLSKRKYLCLTDFDEDYYNFECLNGERRNEDKTWYSICGTPFTNYYEYLVVVGIVCVYGSIIFSQLLSYNLSEKRPQKTKFHRS